MLELPRQRETSHKLCKGGEDKVFMNSLYLFYNASVQGSMAILMRLISRLKLENF